MFKFESVRPTELLEMIEYGWYDLNSQLVLKGGDWRELTEDEKLEIGEGVIDERDGDPIPVNQWRSWTMTEDEIQYDLYIYGSGKYEIFDSMVNMAEEGEWDKFEEEKVSGSVIHDGSTNREIWVMDTGLDMVIGEDKEGTEQIRLVIDGIVKIYKLVEEY